MTKIGADWQLHGYGNAMHAFTTRRPTILRSARSTTPPRMPRSFRFMVDFLFERLEADE